MHRNNDIYDANFSMCVEIIGILWEHKKKEQTFTLTQLINFTKKSKKYINTAISLLEQLEIVTLNDQECNLDSTINKKMDGSKDMSMHILKSKIIRLKPFNEYCNYLNLGKKKEEAAKLVCSIYSLNKSHQIIGKLFDKWVKQLKIDIEVNLNSTNFDSLNNEFSNEVTVLQFLANVLEDDYKNLNSKSLEDLTDALKIYKDNPKKAINDIGRALEDFLRLDIGGDVDLTKCSGITQIVNALKPAGKITPKHQGILTGLGNIRSIGDAHGVDKEHLERWTIRPISALVYCKEVLIAIRSVLAFKNDGSLIY